MSRNGNSLSALQDPRPNVRASKAICEACGRIILIPVGGAFPTFCQYCGTVWVKGERPQPPSPETLPLGLRLLSLVLVVSVVLLVVSLSR